jgi:fructose-1,6-bisphosphatase/sedoheptulose 1,7-bisphosphatase-like protein
MTSLPEQPPLPRLRGNVHYIETEFATRVRQMVIWQAKREAREAVIRRIRAEGKQRVSLMSAGEISALANAYRRANAAELVAQAEASGTVQRLRAEQAALSA